jgi:hypothetical protein
MAKSDATDKTSAPAVKVNIEKVKKRKREQKENVAAALPAVPALFKGSKDKELDDLFSKAVSYLLHKIGR